MLPYIYKGKTYFTKVDKDVAVRLRNISLFTNGNGYIIFRFNYKSKQIYLHRFVMKARKGQEVDHKDNNNKSNNLKSNLRFCTRKQNNYNRPKRKGLSKYKGVSWDKYKSRWQVYIRIASGKETFLGHFVNEKYAVIAYDNAAKKFQGEFAKLNFV